MAKISLTKLGLQKPAETTAIEINGVEIEVKQYLPIQEKLELISRVVNAANEENKFYNPGKVSLFFNLEVLKTYTNISLTEKQKEDFCKTFDLLATNGVFDAIIAAIPQSEISILLSWTTESLNSVFTFNNSMRGLLEAIQNNYDNLDLDLTNLQEKIKDPETLGLLKEIAPLMDLA